MVSNCITLENLVDNIMKVLKFSCVLFRFYGVSINEANNDSRFDSVILDIELQLDLVELFPHRESPDVISAIVCFYRNDAFSLLYIRVSFKRSLIVRAVRRPKPFGDIHYSRPETTR